jgi:hypothetical protein
MKMLVRYIFLGLIVAFSSGCASLTKDDYQRMQIETYSKDNKFVASAKCRAINERGEWVAFSTGTLTVRRSAQNLTVSCAKEGEPTGYATVISRANDGMIGNFFYGGGAGAVLDHHNGNAYSYPDWIRVVMGDNLVFDRRKNKSNQVMIGVQPVESQASSDQRTFVDDILYILP